MTNSDAMINPSVVNLLKKVDNRYSLIISTSKRARQIIDGEEVLVNTKSTKPLTVAINEINQGVITVQRIKDGIK
ncbi:DNA-directed RNA polymerase subunit omega [Hathewaya limosa]|uniref:DNA-directed RNA polymerase subunit omega n=1 Tax=Hathewaya limosa TaxID=1536 RepID=A0ABU0JS24_HATLI|nr:DNA-directed RNA polymerase subunit omega [Hathewaya limosa]AWZ48726.1 DNA-directed RNA polymerase subunit omega [Clostridiaceae bacterium 14S0207]MDQ0478988.1 DNA-directed RNA polymerase subunit omega [Hathewaya limosa]